MVIECPYCEKHVNGKLLGEHVASNTIRTRLSECPDCQSPLVTSHEPDYNFDTDTVESITIRLWPYPERELSPEIPQIVRRSLQDANRCFRAKIHNACAVMCGRALEGICKHFGTKEISLGRGLAELRTKNIIDERLFEWSEALRRSRNLGAHASDENVSADDARDLLDFANAICEFVFVLTARFEAFTKRRQSRSE